MKTILLGLALALTTTGFAQTTGMPPVNVEVSSESQALAEGFAAAFRSITSVPIYLTFERAGIRTVISSVTEVRAVRGVVVVKLSSGLVYVLNPNDILSISDAAPEKS